MELYAPVEAENEGKAIERFLAQINRDREPSEGEIEDLYILWVMESDTPMKFNNFG